MAVVVALAVGSGRWVVGGVEGDTLTMRRRMTTALPADERIPSSPVSHVTLRSTRAPMMPPVHGTCVGTLRLRRVPSGLFPVRCARQCFVRNSALYAPRWP